MTASSFVPAGPLAGYSLERAARPARPPGQRVPFGVVLAGRWRRGPAGRCRRARRCWWRDRTWSTRPGKSPRSPSPTGLPPLLPDAATVSAALRASTAPRSPTWPRTGTTIRRTSCSPGSTWPMARSAAYDIQQLEAAPRHVVLSACDVGRTAVRPGEEILGFTRRPALPRHRGGDRQRHRGGRRRGRRHDDRLPPPARLAGTARPAEALARATGTEPLSPFVCFGGG